MPSHAPSPDRNTIVILDQLVEWGNSRESIAEEAGVDIEHINAVLDGRLSSLMPPSECEKVAEAYVRLYPLRHVALPAEPLLRHRDAIVDRLGGSATLRRMFHRMSRSGIVSYALADELLTGIGLPVELVYGRTAVTATAGAAA